MNCKIRNKETSWSNRMLANNTLEKLEVPRETFVIEISVDNARRVVVHMGQEFLPRSSSIFRVEMR